MVSLCRKFFSHRMAEGTDIEEHIRMMRSWYEDLVIIEDASVTELDWIITLVASLPPSWDPFLQTVELSYDKEQAKKQDSILKLKNRLTKRILFEGRRRAGNNTEGSTVLV